MHDGGPDEMRGRDAGMPASILRMRQEGWRRRRSPAGHGRRLAGALALTVLAVGIGTLINGVAPGIAYFVVLLPAVVFSGAFCGTLEGAIAAILGGLAFALLFAGHRVTAHPWPNNQQIDFVLFLLASASVLWATHRMRTAAVMAVEAQAQLEEVFRQMPCASAIIEAPSGRIVMRSDRSVDVLGGRRDAAGAARLSAHQAIHPDGQTYAPEDYPIVRAMRTGEIIEAEPLVYSHPDGHLADLEVYARPVRIQGRIAGAVGMAFDVTARRMSERKLAAQEATSRALSERLGAALGAGDVGTWELDLATDYITWDAQAAVLFEMPREPLIMKRCDAVRFFDPGDYAVYSEMFSRALEGSAPYDAVPMRGCTATGTAKWFIVRGAVLAADGKAVGVLQDITLEKQREIQLQEALAARDLLMREADHRIKNSLQLVASLLRMQARQVQNPGAEAALKSAEARIDAIAEGHVAFQESQSFERVALDKMIGEVCDRLGLLDPNIVIHREIEAPLILHADRAIPFGLVFSEIITNALRHAFAPGESGTIRVHARRTGGLIHVEAADDGKGYPETAPRQGLGSLIIKTLCNRINAEIETHSRPGEGTRVTIRVPGGEGERGTRQPAPSQ